MFVSTFTENTHSEIQLQTLHPTGPMIGIQVPKDSSSPVLSGPVGPSSTVSAGGLAVSKRFLFFRVMRDFGTNGNPNLMSQVMLQRIDNTTARFIGVAQPFTKFQNTRFYDYSQSVAVTPGSDAVIYTEWDALCGKNVLKAQVFDPQTGRKVGSPQSIIGCSESLLSGSGISGGIDVAQFRP